jgi:hypothetical protein
MTSGLVQYFLALAHFTDKQEAAILFDYAGHSNVRLKAVHSVSYRGSADGPGGLMTVLHSILERREW